MTESDNSEIVCVDIWRNNQHHRVFSIYNAPENKPDLDAIGQNFTIGTLLIGDLNAPSTRWGYPRTSRTGRILEEFLDEHQLSVVPSDYTFLSFKGTCSRPDLAIIHPDMLQRTVLTLHDDPSGCGHRALLLTMRLDKPLPTAKRIPRWNLKNARWQIFKSNTDTKVTIDLITTNIDKSAAAVSKAILNCAHEAVPRGQVRRYRPFWSKPLTLLKKKRNMARKKVESSNRLEDCVLLRKCQADLQKEILLSKRRTYQSFLSKMDFHKDSHKAHRFISSLNNEGNILRNEPIPVGNKTLTSHKSIANALCKHYVAASRLQLSRDDRKKMKLKFPLPAKCLTQEEDEKFNSVFNVAELEVALASLKPGKSAGPDGIFPEFLIHLGDQAKLTVLELINLTWKGQLPNDWRRAEIIPLLKKGKPASSIDSYRPIALTSVVSKLAEKMVACRLDSFIEETGALDPRQSAFRKHRSTIDNVMQLTQVIKDGFHRKMSTLAVMVDFKAAYDKIWRKLMLQKLASCGVRGNMLNWIKQLLAYREIRVRFHQSLSKARQQRQGLPQGAVLSCMLFNVMINDLLNIMGSIPGCNALLFADDLVIWATSSNITSLQNCLNDALKLLAQWTKENKMTVNAEKTVYELFTLSTKPPNIDLQYNDIQLTESDITKYLGVALDRRLQFKTHVHGSVTRANSRLKLLKRLTSVKWGASQDVLKVAYQSYIRPVLEYGHELTDTSSDTNKSQLDKVQNTALRIITGAAKSTPIAAMELQTSLEPLSARREKAVLKFWERSKRINPWCWDTYAPAAHRLKTQTTPLQRAEYLAAKYNIISASPAPVIKSCPVFKTLPTACLSILNHTGPKGNALATELRIASLETIHTLYPEPTWLHIYTDGSSQPDTGNTGAGYFSRLFEGALAVGKPLSNFDGEVAAVLGATIEANKIISNSNVVFFIDSQAAIIAISSNTQTECPLTIACREKLSDLAVHCTVILQWIPSHVGIPGNEKADVLAKEGASMTQPQAPATLNSAYTHITCSVKKSVTRNHTLAAEGKCRLNLPTDGPIPPRYPRPVAVSLFRTTTGHDYLQAHLHRINLTQSDTCPLCNTGRMDALHLLTCSALIAQRQHHLSDPNLQLSSLYWSARRLMAELPRAGVG